MHSVRTLIPPAINIPILRRSTHLRKVEIVPTAKLQEAKSFQRLPRKQPIGPLKLFVLLQEASITAKALSAFTTAVPKLSMVLNSPSKPLHISLLESSTPCSKTAQNTMTSANFITNNVSKNEPSTGSSSRRH